MAPSPLLLPLLLLLLLAAAAFAIDNGLGKVPGIGWNSDYCMNCKGGDASLGGLREESTKESGHLPPQPLRGFQNDAYIRSIAQFMNQSGLQAMGYKYVNMDASWNLPTRDANGNLMPDPALWPQGIETTIGFVNSLGLEFGLYGDRGTYDCAKNPGNLGYEQQDADFYASLGIAWLKSDSCYASQDPDTAFAEYGKMRDALANATSKTGKPIWFALCGWCVALIKQGVAPSIIRGMAARKLTRR
jgi:alpha-galactosidase